MPDLLLRLATASWNGLPIASLAIFAFGGLMYLVINRAPTSSPTSSLEARRRPGWIARRRARGGIVHRRGHIGVGYVSALRSVRLSLAELAGHGLAVGGPKSGKTTFLRLLSQALCGQIPIIIVDPKGSAELANMVRCLGGQVWTLDGKLPADLLDPRPWQVPDLLLEAEEFNGEARVFRDAAHQRALWAAWSLALDGLPIDLVELRGRLDRSTLIAALERHRGRDSRIVDWLTRLGQYDRVAESGAADLDRALGTLLDGVAIRGSLRTCPEALRLDDVLDTRGLVLFSLDELTYPHATRKIAAWVLLAMGRLSRQLPVADSRDGPRAVLLVDELGALGSSARHLRPLVGRAREAGLAVVMATQGLSDLRAVQPALVDQVLQDTAWQIGFRQGSPRDAQMMQALFGQHWVEDVTRYSDGRSSYRPVERPRVPIDEWMNGLHPGDAWLRVAPVDRGWRQERVRVALPTIAEPDRESPPTVSAIERHRARIAESAADFGYQAGQSAEEYPSDIGELVAPPLGLPPRPPECPPELLAKMGADILAKVERRWSKRHHELGACLVWRDGEPTYRAAGGLYGRIYDPSIKRSDYAHRVVWRRCYGPIRIGPNGKPLEVDHLCEITLCQRPDHLEVVTRGENTRRRHARGKSNHETEAEVRPEMGKSTAAFAIALFAGVDRPAVDQRTVSLDELRWLLSHFQVLQDKRRGRCWSPTKYADGATSRGNAGVELVSCLVFDLDRVPPDKHKLADVYWLGHTTWSHKPDAPRWRVVIPLAQPVPARDWQDVWLRARAAMCPEADPACKDPSRAYWLPSHSGGVAAKATCHDGPVLDPHTLPELPTELCAATRTKPKFERQARQDMRGRGEAYMARVIGNLASMAPNSGRNVALNKAASALGAWVAADVLDQTEVEDALYGAATSNGLVAEDGQRQCWATIRSGLRHGLARPFDLDNDHA